MPMSASEIEKRIKAAIPDAQIELRVMPGQGLGNIAQRVAEMDGTCEFTPPAAGQGARLSITILLGTKPTATGRGLCGERRGRPCDKAYAALGRRAKKAVRTRPRPPASRCVTHDAPQCEAAETPPIAGRIFELALLSKIGGRLARRGSMRSFTGR